MDKEPHMNYDMIPIIFLQQSYSYEGVDAKRIFKRG